MDLSSVARYPSLRGRTAFVTGGGSGIGAAIVESFVDQGARVAFVDIACVLHRISSFDGGWA